MNDAQLPLFAEALTVIDVVVDEVAVLAAPPVLEPATLPAEDISEAPENDPREREIYLHHPETGDPLYLPEDWHVEKRGYLWSESKKGEVLIAYTGRIFVQACHRNIASDERFLEVSFDVRGGRREVTAPRRAFASPGSMIKLLTPRGGYVHSGNASKLVRFLSAFETENASVLPERLVSDKLGVMPDGSLVTPTHSVGAQVKFVGDCATRFTAGPDGQAYVRTLREIATWPGAFVLWWLLGLALASPFLRRLKPRRYPVTYVAGDSGSGKTTGGNFALGVWVTPGEEPFVAQGMRTTQVAFLRTLETLGGLPYLIDEAHTVRRPEELESTVYTFANGQSYARGSANGGVAGGTPLGGAVLLVGEARPAFQHAGSHNRLLLVNVDEFPPLGEGAGRGTLLGQERATLLEATWEEGAGHLGPQVAEAVLGNWEGFKGRVAEARQRADVLSLKDWGHAVAVVQVTLEVMFEQVLERSLPDDVRSLPRRLSGMLQAHRTQSNPAAEAFEAIRTLMVQGERRRIQGGEALHVAGEFAGWRNESRWHLLTSSRAFQQRLGEQAVQLHGKRWVEQGWVLPDVKQGSSSQSVYCPARRGSARVVVIPREVLELSM